MTSNDIYERLGVLEQLVAHLYQQTGIRMPDIRALAQAQISDRVRQLLANGDRIGAIKAYREEAGVDLPTASKFIESL